MANSSQKRFKSSYFFLFFLITFNAVSLFSEENLTPSVIVQKIKKENLGKEINLTTSIEAHETVEITSVVSEKIKLIKFSEGTVVKKNETLIELENNEERAILKQVKAELDESILNFDRVKKLADEGNASQAMLDKRLMEKKKLEGKFDEVLAKLNDLIIKAPFEGLIGTKNYSEGSFLKPGDIITTLYDLKKIKVELNIPETFINKIKIDQYFSAKVSSINQTFIGKIFAMDPFIRENTRTFKALGIINSNENFLLKPGMMTNVTIKLDSKLTNMLSEEAIIREDDRTYVYVVNDENFILKKKVIVGIRKNGLIEVIEGINETDLVVIKGTNKIRPKIKVNIDE